VQCHHSDVLLRDLDVASQGIRATVAHSFILLFSSSAWNTGMMSHFFVFTRFNIRYIESISGYTISYTDGSM
jgi:hypothetical protein